MALHRTSRAAPALALLAAALFACGGTGEPAEERSTGPADRLELRSGPALVFSAIGERQAIDVAVLDATGRPVRGAVPSFRSSDAGVVRVDPDGTATAMASLGSAVLTAELGDEAVRIHAVIASLQPDAFPIPGSQVLSAAADVVRLVPTPETLALQAGDVVFSTGSPGFLARVLGARAGADAVVLDVEEASIVDAVQDLDVDLAGPVVGLEATPIPAPAPARASGVARAPTLECMLDGSLVQVGFDGLAVTPAYAFRPMVRYRVRNGALEEFEFAYEGTLGLEVALSAVRISSGLKGKFECALEFPEIPFAPFPVFGAVALTGTATPKVGAALELQYTTPRLVVNGARGRFLEEMRVGFRVDPSGFQGIGERTPVPDEGEPSPATEAPGGTFTAKIEPFMGGVLGLGLLAGPITIEAVGIVAAKTIAGYEVSLSEPIDPMDAGYTGPRWNVFEGNNADIGPLIDNLAVVSRILQPFGLRALGPFVGTDIKLFERKRTLVESPIPVLLADAAAITLPEEAVLRLQSPSPDAGAEAELIGARTGDPGFEPVVFAAVEPQGETTLRHLPEAEGTWLYRALVFDDVYGTIDLPYPSNFQQVEVEGEDPSDEVTDCFPPIADGESYTASRIRETTVTNANGSSTFGISDQESGVMDCSGACIWRVSWVHREWNSAFPDNDVEIRRELDSGFPFASTPTPGCSAEGEYRGWNYTESGESSNGSTHSRWTDTWSRSGCSPVPELPNVPNSRIGCCPASNGWRLCDTANPPLP